MRFLTLLPKALLLLLVIIGVIYCAPSAYAQSETKGGCEKFCASWTKAQVVIASEPKVGKTRDDYEEIDSYSGIVVPVP
ncbi:hypothetical protein Ocin01_15120 [Orchesella cincta]|uniref:Uncharacterized protein n=1 Tax=Orchesella cincta TaxID=48709 RepID=A0A1D2MEX7_ORCCI|nr:hypothetical protein Ocin01_15120 [Orchesella cincta]